MARCLYNSDFATFLYTTLLPYTEYWTTIITAKP